MLKILIFYGGVLAAFVGSVVLWIALPPKYRARSVSDESGRSIRCTVRVSRLLGRQVRLASIWIPTEYVHALGASPPPGFKETKRLVPQWLYDDAKREVVIWNGRVELPGNRTIELSVPAAHPKAVNGTLRFGFECWGIAKVGCSYENVEVPLKSNEG